MSLVKSRWQRFVFGQAVYHHGLLKTTISYSTAVWIRQHLGNPAHQTLRPVLSQTRSHFQTFITELFQQVFQCEQS